MSEVLLRMNTCLKIVQAVGCFLHDALKVIQAPLFGPASHKVHPRDQKVDRWSDNTSQKILNNNSVPQQSQHFAQRLQTMTVKEALFGDWTHGPVNSGVFPTPPLVPSCTDWLPSNSIGHSFVRGE